MFYRANVQHSRYFWIRTLHIFMANIVNAVNYL